MGLKRVGPNLVTQQQQSLYKWFVVVQSLSRVRLFVTPWTGLPVHHQLRSLLKLMSIKLVMQSSHLILCHHLVLLPSIFPSIRVFSKESSLCIRWPKYWSLNFSISPSNEYTGLISFRIDLFGLLAALSRFLSKTTVQKHQFFGIQPSLCSSSHIHTWLLAKHSFDYMNLCWQSNVSVF